VSTNGDEPWIAQSKAADEAQLEPHGRGGPIEKLSHGVGPLWLVILPLPVPAPLAPVAAGILFIWTIFISGDLLDSRGLLSFRGQI
jgi:hypothetical protein